LRKNDIIIIPVVEKEVKEAQVARDKKEVIASPQNHETVTDGQIAVTSHNNANFFHCFPPLKPYVGALGPKSQMRPDGRQKFNSTSCFLVVLHYFRQLQKAVFISL